MATLLHLWHTQTLHGQFSVLVCFPHLLRTAARVTECPLVSRLLQAGMGLNEPCLQEKSKPTCFKAKEFCGVTEVTVWYTSQVIQDQSSCKYIVRLLVKVEVLYYPRPRSWVSTALVHFSPLIFKALAPLILLIHFDSEKSLKHSWRQDGTLSVWADVSKQRQPKEHSRR